MIFDDVMKKMGFSRFKAAYKVNIDYSRPLIAYVRDIGRYTSLYVECYQMKSDSYFRYDFYKKNHFNGEIKLYCEKGSAKTVIHRVNKFLLQTKLLERAILVPRGW